MNPIITKGTNGFVGSEGFERLPIQIYFEKQLNEKCSQVVWQLSDDDLKVINKTKLLFVSVVSENPQPMCLDVIPFAKESI